MEQEEQKIYLIAHNIRSAYNIGALFRTADGIGVKRIYLTGYSPTPAKEGALYKTPAQKMISKTALGAESSLEWEYKRSLGVILDQLKKKSCEIVALEQDEESVCYDVYKPRSGTVALIVGNEPRGLDKRTLEKCDTIIEIPMYGNKNSLNVSIAFGIAGYALARIVRT